ncbi:unnamed protein product [Macrosiphum euphorbiae]|uniref:Transposase Helix-turn-helix domain-containing protein n=1 Tax=Macrosiphum euphorbiae TaxID=13131 RepID=A0AAV0WI71_9HEMI|nr:unnamed protein product [Macrosiphum euphorbiae]
MTTNFESFFVSIASNLILFYHWLELRESLTKEPSLRVPDPITPDEKLAITLRYLATGESFRSLAFAYRISFNISVLVKETLTILKQYLMPIFLPNPKNMVLKVSQKNS